jgi:hypothetical protein
MQRTKGHALSSSRWHISTVGVRVLRTYSTSEIELRARSLSYQSFTAQHAEFTSPSAQSTLDSEATGPSYVSNEKLPEQ